MYKCTNCDSEFNIPYIPLTPLGVCYGGRCPFCGSLEYKTIKTA